MEEESLKDRLIAWEAQMPLRIWRKEHDLSLRRAAAVLGVNIYTLQSWEQGGAFPDLPNQARLVRDTGDADLITRWRAWANATPKP